MECWGTIIGKLLKKLIASLIESHCLSSDLLLLSVCWQWACQIEMFCLLNTLTT